MTAHTSNKPNSSGLIEFLNPKNRADLYDYVFSNGDTPQWLYEYYAEDMPYGTQKARTGDPDNWLADRIERIKNDFSITLENEALHRIAQRKLSF